MTSLPRGAGRPSSPASPNQGAPASGAGSEAALRQELGRVLAQEAKLGYADHAVLGGLDAYLVRWLQRLQTATGSTPGLIPRARYSDLTVDERRRFIAELRRTLADGAPPASSPEPSAHRPSSQGGSPPTSVSDPEPQTPNSKPETRNHEPQTRNPKPATLTRPAALLKGVSAATALRLRRLGIHTLGDLLTHYPRRYVEYRPSTPSTFLQDGAEVTLRATVLAIHEARLGLRMSGAEATIQADDARWRVVWFNQAHLARQLKPGTVLWLHGKVGSFQGRPVLESPDFELNLGEQGGLVPVYPLTEGLYPRALRRLTSSALALCADQVEDPLPPTLRHSLGLLDLRQALWNIHYPGDWAQQQAAQRRLAFEELFLIHIATQQRRRRWQHQAPEAAVPPDGALLSGFLARLPFALTGGQRRALEEIQQDLAQPRPMARLLQGEVGSGKTVVATAALLPLLAAGFQVAVMAPTEILAEQHLHTLESLLDLARPLLHERERDPQVALLTGSLTASRRRSLHRAIEAGEVDLLVGTHALIQEDVALPRLGLAIVDEQHRFGVEQRFSLRQKGGAPHLLVMTATPIPRTLALTIYGDLDISRIDELPAGRQTVTTRLLGPEQRREAYDFVRGQVQAGRQAFIICPLVEESEALDARAATREWERLRGEVFPDLAKAIGLLHGRLRPREKEETMARFHQGDLAILVATPVVEVGIDVPNATVMLVEGAERFGLAQLHQLRGRVGRGPFPSHCLLLSESPSAEASERLSLLEASHDGLALAEEDLRLRGPGEVFGLRQSGVPELRLASLTDLPLVQLSRQAAVDLLERDPEITAPEHAPLARRVARQFGDAAGDLS